MPDNASLSVRWRDLSIDLVGVPESIVESIAGQLDPIRIERFDTAQRVASTAVATVTYGHGEAPGVARDGQGVSITGPAEFWSAQERFACVLLQLFDAAQLARGIVMLHGAAVNLNGSAVVLTGPSDSGKTSTAVRLCRKYGAALICNDHAIIRKSAEGVLEVLPSEDTRLAVRSHALWLGQRDLYDELYGEGSDAPITYRRTRLQPWEIGVATSAERLPLLAVINVGLGTVSGHEFYKTPRIRGLLGLHADITSRVRAADLLLHGDPGGLVPPALPDLSGGDIAAGVLAMLRDIDAQCCVYDARGELDACCESILRLTEERADPASIPVDGMVVAP